MKPWIWIVGSALLPLASAPLHAAPDVTYLQNALDGRGRCLASGNDKVGMEACDKSPGQQWIVAPGDLPGYNTLQTAGAGEMYCLTVQPDARKNAVLMATCGKSDAQQWFIERISNVPKRMRLTNRATGRTRCLESQQTGLKLTPCSRNQAGHLWRSDYLPDM